MLYSLILDLFADAKLFDFPNVLFIRKVVLTLAGAVLTGYNNIWYVRINPGSADLANKWYTIA